MRTYAKKCQIPGGKGRLNKLVYTEKKCYCAKRKLIKRLFID